MKCCPKIVTINMEVLRQKQNVIHDEHVNLSPKRTFITPVIDTWTPAMCLDESSDLSSYPYITLSDLLLPFSVPPFVLESVKADLVHVLNAPRCPKHALDSELRKGLCRNRRHCIILKKTCYSSGKMWSTVVIHVHKTTSEFMVVRMCYKQAADLYGCTFHHWGCL